MHLLQNKYLEVPLSFQNIICVNKGTYNFPIGNIMLFQQRGGNRCLYFLCAFMGQHCVSQDEKYANIIKC